MDKNTALLLGLGLLGFGAYTVMKKRENALAPVAVAPQPQPIVDQGTQPGVAVDAPPVGSGPAFPTQVQPDPVSGTGSTPPSGGNTSADELSFLEQQKRLYSQTDLTQTRTSGTTRDGDITPIVSGTDEPIKKLEIDDKYETVDESIDKSLVDAIGATATYSFSTTRQTEGTVA